MKAIALEIPPRRDAIASEDEGYDLFASHEMGKHTILAAYGWFLGA